MLVGVSIKPNTPVENILPICSTIDNVLIMTVEPGFGGLFICTYLFTIIHLGQSFMAEQMSKVAAIRAQYPKLEIQVDGGVSVKNIEQCAAAGANSFVSGIFPFIIR